MHVKDKDLIETLSGLEGGPTIEAAAYARMNTAVGASRWLGPLGNYLVARPAARAKAHAATERTDLPLDAAVVLAVGGGELHVWSADPMLSQVHDHLGAVALSEIADASTEPSKNWWPLTLRFVDGDEVALQARGDVSGLTAALRAGEPST